MATLAQLTIDRAAAGMNVSSELQAVPPAQWDVYWDELNDLCPSRLVPSLERRPGNALNIEIGLPLSRCKERSPDGRGLAWLLSGGSPHTYGVCGYTHCPRRKP